MNSSLAAEPTHASTRNAPSKESDDTASNYTATNKYDNDADFDNDTIKNKGYYDSDDGAVRSFGRAAIAADRRTIAALVKRYLSLSPS